MSNFNLDFIDRIVSIEDIARNYRAIFDQVLREKKPLIVFKRSKPQVVLVDVDSFQKMQEKIRRQEEEKEALEAIREYKKEKKEGKLKKLTKFSDLTD